MLLKMLSILLFFPLLWFTSCSQSEGSEINRPLNTAGKHYVVIELFTSEGCSSCPPADEVISQLSRDANNNNEPIIFLNYHVDYWNYLGWKDPFSSSEFSDRQNWYKQFGKDDVYTPQVIVNGTAYMVGSNKVKIEQEIDKQLFANADTTVSLNSSIKATEGGNLKLQYSIKGKTDKIQLCVAISEKNLHSAIKAGENKGLSVNHSSVVRYFKTQLNPDASGTLPLSFVPTGEKDKYTAVAFLQRTDNGEIISVQPLSIQ
jgi:hypothetical protein